jgi:hypothetical protein
VHKSGKTSRYGSVAFGSFGFGGPDLPQPPKRDSLSPGSGSVRKKRHSLFGRHDASGEKDKDDVKEKEKVCFFPFLCSNE